VPSCLVLIFLWALVFGALGFMAVAFVEARSVDEKSTFRYLRKSDLRLPEYLRSKLWKPLWGGFAAAALAGGSAAEDLVDDLGTKLEKHPVLVSALTGAVLAIIVVLVIEALFRFVATTAWTGSLRATWVSVVRGGRRGAYDLHEQLGGSYHSPLTKAHLPAPDPEAEESEAKEAYEVAQKLWVGLESRVTNASVAAFASDHPELGESMHRLSTAADTLQRALERYSSNKRSHTTGELRTPDDIVRMWRDYVWCLLDVDERGCRLGFHLAQLDESHAPRLDEPDAPTLDESHAPMLDESRNWLQSEIEGHKLSPWLRTAIAAAGLTTGQHSTPH
jgi:hypothetical protein